MDAAIALDASSYHQFPNYNEIESEYMHFLTHGRQQAPAKAPVTKAKGDSFLVKEIQKVRECIKSSLDGATTTPIMTSDSRFDHLESIIQKLSTRILDLETEINRMKNIHISVAKKPAPAAQVVDDDDIDLFSSGDDEELEKVKAQRTAAYNEKKKNKAKEVAKSSIILDVKPWDDTTNMDEMEKLVRSIKCDGLVWGVSKRIPVIHGIYKLQICCVVEDEKVGTDFLDETICEFKDHVQSVDIAGFNKI